LVASLASFVRDNFEAEMALVRQRDALLADLLNCPVQTSPPDELRLRRGSDLSPARALESILRRGWSFPEHWGIWSVGAKSMLQLAFDRDTLFPVTAKFDLLAFVPPDSTQSIGISVNGRHATMLEFERSYPERTESVEIHPGDISPDLSVSISFDVARPTCPADVGPSSDRRKLGVALRRLRIV
jgi:hypothetical protein